MRFVKSNYKFTDKYKNVYGLLQDGDVAMFVSGHMAQPDSNRTINKRWLKKMRKLAKEKKEL